MQESREARNDEGCRKKRSDNGGKQERRLSFDRTRYQVNRLDLISSRFGAALHRGMQDR